MKFLTLALFSFLLLQTKPVTLPPVATTSNLPEKLTVTEFKHLMTEFSEPGGDFLSDNLISNETAYLPVLNKLQELNASGGAYIGVGPEQNFSYIAKIRPRIAFIVDIRHMAVTQHLMYKAIFQLSADRAQFLSRLLSRPLSQEKPLTATASIAELLKYFGAAKSDDKVFAANFEAIRQTIEKDFQIKLAEFDLKELDYLLKNFKVDGLDIAFRLGGGWSSFPSLKEILVQTDPTGKSNHFLASAGDYNYLRQMHMKNLIIPINGDFAGKKALASIGDYLRKNNVTVTTFYLSNVEQYLFGDGLFPGFAANIKKLPINEQSLFIRSIWERYDHPAHLPGHLFTMTLQRMTVFVQDYDAGRYHDYYRLLDTHYISTAQ